MDGYRTQFQDREQRGVTRQRIIGLHQQLDQLRQRQDQGRGLSPEITAHEIAMYEGFLELHMRNETVGH